MALSPLARLAVAVSGPLAAGVVVGAALAAGPRVAGHPSVVAGRRAVGHQAVVRPAHGQARVRLGGRVEARGGRAAARTAGGAGPGLWSGPLGTNSTPAAFVIPQVGSAGIRCGPGFRSRPYFDSRGAWSQDTVTITVGHTVRRNFTSRVIGRLRGRVLRANAYPPDPVTALPAGHYGTVHFTVVSGDEARILHVGLSAQLVDGTFHRAGYPAFGSCMVRRWAISMRVGTYGPAG